MSWRDLLASSAELTLPWLGGRKVCDGERVWSVSGSLPVEFGWHRFETDGSRRATLAGDAEPDPAYEDQYKNSLVRGYLAGNRLIPDDARITPDPTKLIEQTVNVFLVEPGLERFVRAVVVHDQLGRHLFIRQEFPTGPEYEVQAAYEDRLDNLDHITGVIPSLDFAFRWESYQRLRAEEWAREQERRRAEEEAERQRQERIAEARRNMGTAAGRRALAQHDFTAAARAALAVSGAELLDARPEDRRGRNMVVRYRFRHERLECVCDRDTLRIVDAGICLTDHYTGEKGDTRFTLESLPTVVGQAMNEHRLVVWRHG